MDTWLKSPAADQARALAKGEINAQALTEAYLDAIEAHPSRDEIYARTTADRARAEARAAADRAKRGTQLGPLDGVPISWKDLYDSAGVATEGGTRLLKGRVPEADCTVLVRGTAAGTVCLGKTHTTELAFSGLGVNPMTATPPNSIDPPRAPGGSSSGAAVSTNLGLAAAGIGSDTGGSVRIPAGWNDLVGLKTTAGRIPTDGVIALSRTYDTVGPLTRTVEDAALLYAMLADLPVPDWDRGSLSDEKLLVAETLVLDGCDDGVVEAMDDALSRLAAAGMQISRGLIPEFQGVFDTMRDLSPLVPVEAWDEWGDVIEANPDTMWAPIEKRFRQGMTPDRDADGRATDQMMRHSVSLQDRMGKQGLIGVIVKSGV